MRDMGRTRAVALTLAALTLAAVVPTHAGAGPGLAPMFALEELNGKPVSLAAYKGSPVILLFWAPW